MRKSLVASVMPAAVRLDTLVSIGVAICLRASAILRHTYASHLAMNGVPMAVIAAILGHGDTRMTEKHYAHLSPDHVALTLRAKAPKLGIAEASNVVAFAAKN